jgi:nicotinamidase-related amidase
MIKRALILVDCQADNIALGGDYPIKRFKQFYEPVELVVASRRYAPKVCKKGTPGARITPYVSKRAQAVVTKDDGVSPSAFEGGSLRPIESTEHILKTYGITHVIVGGYFIEWSVSQTAFDASALGLDTTVDLSITASEDGIDYSANYRNTIYEPESIFGRLTQAGVRIVTSRPATMDK